MLTNTNSFHFCLDWSSFSNRWFCLKGVLQSFQVVVIYKNSLHVRIYALILTRFGWKGFQLMLDSYFSFYWAYFFKCITHYSLLNFSYVSLCSLFVSSIFLLVLTTISSLAFTFRPPFDFMFLFIRVTDPHFVSSNSSCATWNIIKVYT